MSENPLDEVRMTSFGEKKMSDFDLDGVKARKKFASLMVSALCSKERDWIMSIPARPEYDPDLVISNSLKDIPELIQEIERLQGEVERAQGEEKSAYDNCDSTLAVDRENNR